MLIKINDTEIAAYPIKFDPKIMDLDDAETTVRSSDGKLHRDRITTLRQVDMEWGALPQDKVKLILQSMTGQFFEMYYYDPLLGYVTKTFYCGDRPVPTAIEKNGVIWYNGLKITLTEQ